MKLKFYEQFWFGPAIGFLVGLVWTQHIVGCLVLAFVGLLVQGGILTSQFRHGFIDDRKEESRTTFLESEEHYLETIMSLAAVVIKADGLVSEKELQHVEKKLSRDFSEKYVRRQMEFLKLRLAQNYPVSAYTGVVVEEFTEASKIQLLHFLVGIAAADGVLAQAEYKCLQSIAAKIELNLRTLDTILAMFRFRHEYEKQQERPPKKASAQLLDAAYQVLEIAKTVPDAEVKRAYRRLAVIHHPDKAAHLGAEFQKAANDKFQTIVAAYELIQKARGFV